MLIGILQTGLAPEALAPFAWSKTNSLQALMSVTAG
jgi:hypothetical protein